MPADSLVLIDEFENGLGVNCIDLLSDLMLSERNDLQFIITSHHPKIINAVDKDKWRIIDRDTYVVKNSASSAIIVVEFIFLADFSWQILFQPRLQMFYCICRVHETSPGTHTLFPSYTHSINTKYSSVQLLDFGLSRNLIPAFSLKCSRPEFCLILSSDSVSRRTPLASAVSFPLPGGLGTFTR